MGEDEVRGGILTVIKTVLAWADCAELLCNLSIRISKDAYSKPLKYVGEIILKLAFLLSLLSTFIWLNGRLQS